MKAGGQNWTEGFEQEFLKRRGYDMKPYFPSIVGYVVGYGRSKVPVSCTISNGPSPTCLRKTTTIILPNCVTGTG